MIFQNLPEAFLFIGTTLSLVFWLVTTVFVIWMLIDAITRASLTGTEKIIWVLVILFLHVLGALVYFFVGRGGTRSGPVV